MYNKIKIYRKSNKMTQKQVADLLGIDRSTYSYYENGKRSPSIQILTRLAKIYRISVDDLISFRSQQNDILKDDSLLYNKNDNPENDENEYLSEIDDVEKQALLLFRLIEDKDEVLKVLKQKMEEENQG